MELWLPLGNTILVFAELSTYTRRGHSMTQAQQALAAIQAYGAPVPTADDHTHVRDLWEAVI